jgi:hypothetical protein
MNKRRAGLLERDGMIFVYSEHTTTSGLHIQQDDAVAVSVSDLEGIGRALRNALAAYQAAIPHPDFKSFKPLDAHKRLLSLAGVRSLRAFYSKAKMVSATDDEGSLRLKPWRAEGKTSEFTPVTGRDQLLAPTATNREIGEAVFAALGDAVR